MLKILEKSFVVFAMLYFAGALIVILQPDNLPQPDEPAGNMSMVMMRAADKGNDQDPTQKKNKIKIATQVGIYGITFFLILFNLREFMRLFLKHPWLWLLLVMAVGSVVWSDSPGFTLRRSLVLLASTCFGVYLAQRYTMREILRMLWIVGVIAAIGSLIVVWRKPDMGVASGATAGDWQGLFGQKNTLGRFMAFEVMACGIGVIAEKGVWRWFCIFGVLICLPLLIMSKDATAYLVLPVLLLLLPLFQYARKHSLVRMTAFLSTLGATVVGIVFLMIIDPQKILLLLGKNSTLSGRTDIWSMVWDKFLQRPWLGYGYSAFWMGKDGKESAEIWEALHWPVPHSHNGFLDVLVQVGAIGLLLFLVGYAIFFYKALRCARASKTILGLFPMLYLCFMILFNFSEGSIIREENLFWVLYAAMWVLTTRWLELAQARARRSVPAVSMASAVRTGVVQPRTVPASAWRFGPTN
jgi:exopolysaccharide production protein ExoQ